MKKFIFILFIFNFCSARSQVKDTLVQPKDSVLHKKRLFKRDTLPYNRKEEFLYKGMRFRRYNSYLTFGAGFAYSNVRKYMQKLIDFDFHFHLQRNYFQIGFLMSGDEFLSNNNLQGHICYGLRRERNNTNFAAFIGPSYSSFLTARNDTAGKPTIPVINNELGGYICLQGIYKFKYDVGIGLELFANISSSQIMAGGRVVIYFSGAYRGIKRGINQTRKS